MCEKNDADRVFSERMMGCSEHDRDVVAEAHRIVQQRELREMYDKCMADTDAREHDQTATSNA